MENSEIKETCGPCMCSLTCYTLGEQTQWAALLPPQCVQLVADVQNSSPTMQCLNFTRYVTPSTN